MFGIPFDITGKAEQQELHKAFEEKQKRTMKQWTTEISAHDPATGELKKWAGPHVPGINQADAQHYCNEHGLGYCKVGGQLISETPNKGDSIIPDWDNKTDYENISNN